MTPQQLRMELQLCDSIKPHRKFNKNNGKISVLCKRGSHEGNTQKILCKGRNCTCDCHGTSHGMKKNHGVVL